MNEKLHGLFVDAKKLLHSAGLKEGDVVLEFGCDLGFFTFPATEIVGKK